MNRIIPLLRRVSAAALFVTVALAGLVGCSNQGEGERCDLNNGNKDCASGLSCQRIEGQESALCCPPPPKPTTVTACIPGQIERPDGGIDTGVTRDANTEDSADADAQTQDAENQDAELDTQDAENQDAELDAQDAENQDAELDAQDAENQDAELDAQDAENQDADAQDDDA